MGVGYLFCGYYVPVFFNTTISLEVTKMLYLFWTDQPQPNCQTWCVLRLGTTGCVHLYVSLRLEIRFGFKSAQNCGLLLHRGSLSLALGAEPQQCNNESFLHEEYILVFDLLKLLLCGSSDSVVRTILGLLCWGTGQPLFSLHSLRCTQRPLDTPFGSFNLLITGIPDVTIQFHIFPALSHVGLPSEGYIVFRYDQR